MLEESKETRTVNPDDEEIDWLRAELERVTNELQKVQ